MAAGDSEPPAPPGAAHIYISGVPLPGNFNKLRSPLPTPSPLLSPLRGSVYVIAQETGTIHISQAHPPLWLTWSTTPRRSATTRIGDMSGRRLVLCHMTPQCLTRSRPMCARQHRPLIRSSMHLQCTLIRTWIQKST